MRSALAADWILSLVAAQDRAASTVGDLVEEASSRGVLWFWSSVLRTAGSHLWHDLSVSPLRTVRLAFWGLLANWWLGFLLASFATTVWISVSDHLGLGVHFQGGSVISVPPWGYSILTIAICTAVPFLVGWKVARRSDGRELAAAFALVALFAVFQLLVHYLSAMQVGRIGRPWPGIENAFSVFCARVPCVIAGAMLFRCRARAKRESAC
jgi:hypothetical protein